MPRKKAAVKPISQSLKGSSCVRTPLAKRVHFEEETQTQTPSPPAPQAKKRRDVRAHDRAKQQAEKKTADRKKREEEEAALQQQIRDDEYREEEEARIEARNQEWRAQQEQENTERRLREKEVCRQARIPRDHSPEPGNKDYDTDEEYWREQDASDLLKRRDFPVHVHWKAFYNKGVIFNDNRGETVRSLVEDKHNEIDIIFEGKFSETAQASGHAFEIVSRSITVRSHKLCVPKVQQTVDDFSSENWTKVDEILGVMWLKTFEDMDLIIEVKAVKKPGSLAPKRQRETVSDCNPNDTITMSSPDPKQRRTRTTYLLGQQDSKLEERARQGRHEKDIVDRWQCQSARCRNFQSFCFVDFNNEHYNIQTSHMERWANAICVGEATKEDPPRALYKLWVSQSAVDVQYKTPFAKQDREEKKDYMAQGMATLIEMNERAFQMKMAQSLQKMTAGLGDTEQSAPVYPGYAVAAPLQPPSLPLPPQPYRVDYAAASTLICCHIY